MAAFVAASRPKSSAMKNISRLMAGGYNAAMATGGQFLVSGGTGFIGRFVVRRLLERGDRVRLLCRQETKARQLFAQ